MPVVKMARKDREITKQIRQGLNRNHKLSTSAKNIEIIADDGHVTLRGPVASEAELNAVLRSANSAVGAARVQNEMTINSDSPEAMPGISPGFP